MHGPISNLESLGCKAWKLDGLERRGGEVSHPAASDTVEMVVAPSPQFETRAPAGMRDPAGEPELHQGFEHTVDGRPGDTRHPLAYGLEQIIRAWVVLPRR